MTEEAERRLKRLEVTAIAIVNESKPIEPLTSLETHGEGTDVFKGTERVAHRHPEGHTRHERVEGILNARRICSGQYAAKGISLPISQRDLLSLGERDLPVSFFARTRPRD